MIPARALLALMLCTSAVHAQENPTLTFHFERIGMPVPVYTLAVHPDGTGTYAATYLAPVALPSRYAAADASTSAPPPADDVKVPFTISAASTAKLFERARATGYFHAGCESKAKHIADSGAKTLEYAGTEGAGRCSYNYTENKAISALTDTFQAIAVTLDFGRALAIKHRYDHLGLDKDMADLAEAVKDGRAIEMGAIAPVLHSIADDTQLLERVRTQAARLLAQVR